MRKFNLKTIGSDSRVVTQPATQLLHRKMTIQDLPSLDRVGNLGSFHDQLLLKEKRMISNIGRSQNIIKTEDTREYWRKKSIHKDLVKATEALSDMKRQLTHKKTQQTKQYHKLNRFIDSLESSLEQKKYQQMLKINQSPPPPIYYPIPMPIPMFNNPNIQLPYINQTKKSRNQSLYTRSSFNSKYRNDSFYQQSTKSNPHNKGAGLKKNKRRFKKVVNCILFTLYLNNFCRKIREIRKIAFSKLQPSLQPTLLQISDNITKLLKPFYSLLFAKRQVSYDIQPAQNKSILKGKIESIRRFIQLILEASKKWLEVALSSKKYVELFYHLCRHGNYSCSIPILTPDELQLTCISPKLKYVSADRNLQNAAFINVFYMKILIYNILLSPQKVSSQFQDQILSNNLYVLSSVLYELAIQVQDQYMMKVPKIYKIGNFTQLSGVQSSPPLVYQRVLKCEGELISGLKGEEWVRKYFYFQSWSVEKKLMNDSIGLFHKAMGKYHQQMSRKCF